MLIELFDFTIRRHLCIEKTNFTFDSEETIMKFMEYNNYFNKL